MEIKENPKDFIVEEITPDGTVLEVGKNWEFSDGNGNQLVCVLEKVNWDTNRAIKAISKRLHVSRKRIGFAGTKDKRAWTTQRISIWGINTEDVEGVKLKALRVCPLQYGDRVNIGDLWGNRFTIRVIHISRDEMKRFDLPREFRVPNFFGIQRFGEKRPVTHLVGKAIVLGDLELAVKTYLTWVGPGEKEETKDARRRLSESWDWKSALGYFPDHLSFERTLLSYLSMHPRDYANALRKLPKNLVKMFVHGYQSFLFNRYLDERMVRIGLDPVRGDIIVNGIPTGPLYGYNLELATGEPGEIESEIIRSEGIGLGDFRISQLPEASSKGARRPIYTLVRDYEILESGADWLKIRFKLEKGSYATTVLDWIGGVKHNLPDSL